MIGDPKKEKQAVFAAVRSIVHEAQCPSDFGC